MAVVIGRRNPPVLQHRERVRALAAQGLTDPAIGARLGLSTDQVYGIRRRANPPIPAGLGRCGRPKGAKDSYPRPRRAR